MCETNCILHIWELLFKDTIMNLIITLIFSYLFVLQCCDFYSLWRTFDKKTKYIYIFLHHSRKRFLPNVHDCVIYDIPCHSKFLKSFLYTHIQMHAIYVYARVNSSSTEHNSLNNYISKINSNDFTYIFNEWNIHSNLF